MQVYPHPRHNAIDIMDPKYLWLKRLAVWMFLRTVFSRVVLQVILHDENDENDDVMM